MLSFERGVFCVAKSCRCLKVESWHKETGEVAGVEVIVWKMTGLALNGIHQMVGASLCQASCEVLTSVGKLGAWTTAVTTMNQQEFKAEEA
jgi:hypothetical protein